MATIKITNHQIGFKEKFLFDTNIWLLLYGTIANFQRSDQNKYSDFLEKTIKSNSPIYITSMIVSEFANVQIRRYFKQWISNNNPINRDFKPHFIATQEYKESVSIISALINRILKLPNIIMVGDDFNAIDKNALLENFNTVDFNDSYLYQLAFLNKYTLVTNDKDFQILESKVTILTTQI